MATAAERAAALEVARRLGDRRAAALLGIPRSTLRVWRKRAATPAKPTPAKQAPPPDVPIEERLAAAVAELTAAGMSASVAAAVVLTGWQEQVRHARVTHWPAEQWVQGLARFGDLVSDDPRVWTQWLSWRPPAPYPGRRIPAGLGRLAAGARLVSSAELDQRHPPRVPRRPAAAFDEAHFAPPEDPAAAAQWAAHVEADRQRRRERGQRRRG